MRLTTSHFLAASTLLALASCSSTKPATRAEPDLALLRTIIEAEPESPRPGHTHADTRLQPIEVFEVKSDSDVVLDLAGEELEVQDPERIRVRRVHRNDTSESRGTIVVLHGKQGRIETPVRKRKYHFEHEGWYIGGNYGWTDGDESAGKLQNDLNRRTPAGRNVSVSLDDTDWGFKGFVGYRFDNPFAIELAYTGLDGPDSAVNAPVIDSNLIGDVGELHPITGRGPSLSLLGHPYESGRLSTFAKLGFWYWQADVDVDVAGTNVNKSPDGWDFVVGLGGQYRLIDGLSARVEYERYFLDDDGVDMLSLGLTYKF